MAEEEVPAIQVQQEFPSGRVKRIMKLDKEIHKVTSEALFLVSRSTELFLKSLAEKSAVVAIGKKGRTIRLDHLRLAITKHQPTSDFLLDSLPWPIRSKMPENIKKRPASTFDNSVPVSTRRIEDFFSK